MLLGDHGTERDECIVVTMYITETHTHSPSSQRRSGRREMELLKGAETLKTRV